MDDQNGTKVSTEEASTNMYWTFGEEEVFNLQTTVRGAITEAQINAHITSVKATMLAIIKRGGHAKQVGAGSSQASANNQPAQASPFNFRKGAKGRTYIDLNGATEPNEIVCPLHGSKMKRRTDGPDVWWSHKGPDDKWCSVHLPGKQE